MMKKFTWVLLVSLPIVFMGCNKDYSEIDRELIVSYLNENNLSAEETEDGLFYIITELGTGSHPTIDNKVTVNYVGKLLNGSVFDSNNNISFPLRGVIEGWQKGIPLIRKGGSATLLIPSQLGYGSQSVGTIPANSVLVFEVDLLDIE